MLNTEVHSFASHPYDMEKKYITGKSNFLIKWIECLCVLYIVYLSQYISLFSISSENFDVIEYAKKKQKPKTK